MSNSTQADLPLPPFIPPTVGRVVHYYPDGVYGSDERAALIAGVNDDGTLNLAWFDAYGHHRNAVGVPLLQGGDPLPTAFMPVGFARWMPYQLDQAARTARDEAPRVQSNRDAEHKPSATGA